MCIGKANDLRSIAFVQSDRRAHDVTIVSLGHGINPHVRAIEARADFVGTGFFREFGDVIVLRANRVPFEDRISAPGHEAYLDDGANGLADACQSSGSLVR